MSKNFELLRQAQREQELLNPSLPPASTNSRNFEILRQTRKETELFEAPGATRGALPDSVPSRDTGFSPGETFKLVRRLFLSTNALSPRMVVFCTVDRGGEQNGISARVAELLASHLDASVCAVDANLTNPSLHSYFEMENDKGLAGAMLDGHRVQGFAVPTGRNRLSVMPAGLPPPGVESNSLLAIARLRERIRELRANFDYVIVEAPPVAGESVTPFLAGLSDGAILVVEPSFTPRESARRAKEEIEAANGRVLGVVLYRRDLQLLDRPEMPTRDSKE